jgi:hypothetical protein
VSRLTARQLRNIHVSTIMKDVFYVVRAAAESNTCTVTLRVVGGDKKGSLKSGTVIYGREYQGTRVRERLRWQGPAAYTKDRPVLSSERAPHKNKTVKCQTSNSNKYLVMSPR